MPILALFEITLKRLLLAELLISFLSLDLIDKDAKIKEKSCSKNCDD